MKNKHLQRIITVILICVGVTSCSLTQKKYYKSGISMGTNTAITIFSDRPKKIVEADIEHAFALSLTLENKVSCHIEDSVIGMLNSNGFGEVTDDFVLTLINKSFEYSEITGGTFDPTLSNVLTLWGFSETPRLPSDDEIKQSLLNCGYKKTEIIGNRVNLNGVKLDLGGIAKGAIVQRIADYLKRLGYKNFLVNGGGDIYVSGKFADKRLWRIAVADPFTLGEYIDRIELSDCAVVTSGDYQRFFEQDGVVYHHILNPSDGYPAKNGVHSVTVINSDTMFADAMATAIFVMGQKEGVEFCRRLNIKAIIVSGDKSSPQIDKIGM